MAKETTERFLGDHAESELKLTGRILWLTKDPKLVQQQIEGKDFAYFPTEDLADRVSTDEIIPSVYCLFSTSEELGDYALTGFRGDVIKPGDIKRGSFDKIVAGTSFGCGSAREHAPLSLKGAGIKVIAGRNTEGIFLANCQNQGLYLITDESQIERLLTEKIIDTEQIAGSFDAVSADVVRSRGLLPYLVARQGGRIRESEVDADPKRKMTLAEKIIARHLIANGNVGIPAVKPGDAGFVKADFTYSYEIMTPLAEETLKREVGNFVLKNVERIALYEDHTAIAEKLKENNQTGPLISKLLTSQRRFARAYGIKLNSPDVGICHNDVAKKHVLPGEIIFGTDSHTCSEGAIGALAIGIGATEMAGVWLTGECRVKVPATWRFNLKGRLQNGVTAKDIMLFINSRNEVQSGQAVGKVYEYAGEGLESLSFDGQFVLANMAAEAGAFTGIVEPNNVSLDFLVKHHKELSRRQLEQMRLKSDEDADFEQDVEVDLSTIPIMVARPNSPRDCVPLADLPPVKADAVYIGSCTGGNLEDLKKAAEVFQPEEDGLVREVIIPTYIQASTGEIREEAEKLGYIEIFRRAGVIVVEAGCGDCCNLGMGVAQKGEVIVSDTNRNFPGRMGPADVFLVNPNVAAMTAVLGRLPTQEEVESFAKAA